MFRDWKAKRNHFYGHLKLPQGCSGISEVCDQHLDESLARLRDAVVCGKLKIDDAIHIDPLVANATPANVETLRGYCGQLPEILIDSATRFSWLLLGREPHSPQRIAIGLRSDTRARHIDVGCGSRPEWCRSETPRYSMPDSEQLAPIKTLTKQVLEFFCAASYQVV
ncbi:hypothetical protein E0W60_31540 (plasmid) [Cupriavidus oxalaticus]|uniref:Uncharacterized protein n=1 Tax=Cupriavidus oxalaticus TaxID=96344 RepID=A0A4P7LIB8_9BURK|nr:hypothetical protein [Cupriavidus oxalaticus]QBY55545.1 hypothetical protein E0W60_31540 [Cupriavidus oxalaticus]